MIADPVELVKKGVEEFFIAEFKQLVANLMSESPGEGRAQFARGMVFLEEATAIAMDVLTKKEA